ncbi:septum formation protein Maf [Fusibacter paucivorans]|uniref:dTTP/UTP pyrophosphatase n=1 Tax=Fusibacter paucivorans TaxID=76009 RepID=A0ABS5PPK4_9FIRM|nr:Maf family protein [Fusibacter paucivorans]MBS7526837.1 septum formation protein Maf [Fusibacter paucivorans]
MKIILASQSPRRIALLEAFNLQFEAEPSTSEEVYDETDDPKCVVMSLAFEKGYEIAQKHPEDIVLSFDTVVYSDKILGKPKDEEDALEMLKALNGKTHQVFTGLSIIKLNENIKITDVSETCVTFVQTDEATLKRYVDTGEPLDKAGAYGIQGSGAVLVDRIDGDYYTVMGLPLSKLNDYLNQLFNIQML